MPKLCFAIAPKFKGIDIFDEERIFGHQLPISGISYNQELDWIFAAWEDNQSAWEFSRRSGSYQSMIVAAYRIRRQIDAVLSEDSKMKSEADQARREAERLSKGR